MKKFNKKFWVIVLSLSVLVVICGLGYLCWYLGNIYMSGNEYKVLKEEVSSTISESDTSSTVIDDVVDSSDYSSVPDDVSSKETSSANKESSVASEAKDVVNGDINFTELWKVNTDVYAWIRIPNTLVDYPILQSDVDDSFYLEHNVYKQYAFAGSIYSEMINSKDFSDPNTVLYGHNMLNGSMFATLHNFRDPDFFAQNEYIYIYMPDRTLTYQIFSAYEYDDRHIMYSFDFNDEESYSEYLEYAKNPTSSMTANIREIEVTTDDKIITLSTCMDDIDTSRYLVQGVLVSDEPTEQ